MGLRILLSFCLLATIAAQSFPNGYAWGCTNISKALPFCDPSLPVAERVADLVGRLNITEKLALLGPDTVNTGVDECSFMDAGILRLGVPTFLHLVEVNSAVAGECLSENVCTTEFPSPALLASSFNRTLWQAKGKIISDEVRALNNINWYRGVDVPNAFVGLTGFGPNINIVRDPRFGRNSELPSEDPFLAGSYAVEYVKAMQTLSDDKKFFKMIAGLKHFAAYSVEDDRSSRIFNITTFDLYDTYLAQYAMGFARDQGNAQATMCSYAGINGFPSCANSWLLNQVLRIQWNRSDVVVVSDCGALNNMVYANRYAASPPEAAADALNAGCDLDLGDPYYAPENTGGKNYLGEAIELNLTTEAQVDISLSRVLTQRFTTGQFDPLDNQPFTRIGKEVVNSSDSQALMLDSALQGFILLKNNDNTLPFSLGKKIAVVGPHVISQRDLLEDYKGDQVCFGTDDESCVRTIGEVFTTLHGAANTIVETGVDLDSTDASRIPAALAAVEAADQVILCIGIGNEQEHETLDRVDTLLPGLQETFAEQVLSYGKPTVIVLINGGIVSIDNLIPRVPAIIEGWYPALRGAEALYQAIFGLSNRWGKLPVTIYSATYVNQVDMYNFNVTQYPGRTYRYFQGDPLFPFGFGLSYTQFVISCTRSSGSMTVRCVVENTGLREGDEIVLMYHRVSDTIKNSVDHPVPLRALVDFTRIGPMKAGENQNTPDFIIDDTKLALTTNDGTKKVYSGDHYFDFTDGVGKTVTITYTVA